MLYSLHHNKNGKNNKSANKKGGTLFRRWVLSFEHGF
jgi:hypothetical protein